MMSMKIALLEEELAASELRARGETPSSTNSSIQLGGELEGTLAFGSQNVKRISKLVSTVQANNTFMLSVLRESTSRQVASSSILGAKAPIDRRTK